MTAIARVVVNPIGTNVKSFLLDVDKICGLNELLDGTVVLAYRKQENTVPIRMCVDNSFEELAIASNRGLSTRFVVNLHDPYVKRLLVNRDKVVGLVERLDSPYVELTFSLTLDYGSPTRKVYLRDSFESIASQLV